MSRVQIQFNQKTLQLLAEQDQEIAVHKAKEQDVLGRLRESVSVTQQQLTELNEDRESLDCLLEKLDGSLKSVKLDLENTRQEHKKLAIEIVDIHQDIKESKALYETLSSQISKSQNEKSRLEDDIKYIKKQELQSADLKKEAVAIYDAEIAEKKKELSLLDVTKNDILLQVEEIKKEVQFDRSDIATRQKLLEERDLNLRAREAKAAEKEGNILRNSDLLNL